MIIESMTEGVFRASFIPSLKADHFPMLSTILCLVWAVSCIAETDTRKGRGVKRATQGSVERGMVGASLGALELALNMFINLFSVTNVDDMDKL